MRRKGNVAILVVLLAAGGIGYLVYAGNVDISSEDGSGLTDLDGDARKQFAGAETTCSDVGGSCMDSSHCRSIGGDTLDPDKSCGSGEVCCG